MTCSQTIAFLGGAYLSDESTGIDGTQVQMYMLSRAFAKHGLTVHYIAKTKSKSPAVDDGDGVRLHWIHAPGLWAYWWRDVGAAWRHLDRIKPDVVYQRGRSSLTYAAAVWARRNGARFVWASNGEDSCDFWRNISRTWRSARPLWKKSLLSLYFVVPDILIHRGIRASDRVINQTAHQKKQLKQNYGKDGIVLPSLFPTPSVGPAQSEKLVLWLANAGPGKQPHLFAELAARCADVADWRFVLAGRIVESRYGISLRQRIDQLPNVEAVGAVPFKASEDWYQRAAIFVNTSLPGSDGLPNAFLQAWHGGAVILSLHHDPNGWLAEKGIGFCANGDFEALVARALELITSPQELRDISDRGRNFAQKTFDNEDIIENYILVFFANKGP